MIRTADFEDLPVFDRDNPKLPCRISWEELAPALGREQGSGVFLTSRARTPDGGTTIVAVDYTSGAVVAGNPDQGDETMILFGRVDSLGEREAAAGHLMGDEARSHAFVKACHLVGLDWPAVMERPLQEMVEFAQDPLSKVLARGPIGL